MRRNARTEKHPAPLTCAYEKGVRRLGGAGVMDVAMSRAGSAAILRVMRAGNGGMGCGEETVAELLDHTLGHFPDLVRW